MAVPTDPKSTPEPVPESVPKSLRATAEALETATEAGETFGRTMAGQTKVLKSLEEAYNNFQAAIKQVGLQEATKLFYENYDAVTKLRQGYGDLEAGQENIRDKISLMSQAISDSENTLRKFASQVKIAKEEQVKLEEAHTNTAVAIQKANQLVISSEKELADLTARKVDAEMSITGLANDRLRLDQNIATETDAHAKRDLEIRKQEIEFLEKQAKAEKENLELSIATENGTLDQRKKNLEIAKAEATISEEKATNSRLEVKELEKKFDLETRLAAAMLPLQKFEKARLEALNKSGNYMDSIVSKLTSGAEKTNFFGSAMFGMVQGLDKANGGAKNLVSIMGEGLKESLLDPEKAFNRVANLINDRLIKSTLEFDKTLASVGKSTGGFRKEFESIAFSGGEQTFRNLSQFGVTLEKYGQTYSSLSKTIGNFNNMQEQQRKNLTNTAASLETLGVSTETFGKIVANTMASTGKSADASRQVIETLAKDAIALGKSVGEYTRDFETAMSKISGYGRETLTIFKELNAVSMATKGVITSQDLLSISDRFKDFDSAADSVSKLNAILGGTSVNILDMMKADPAEQIMAIKRAATESGLEFDKLNIGYKRLLAEYFGGDVSKAAAFFKADLQEATDLMSKAAASEEELAKKKEQNVAFQDKLNALLDNMKVSLTPILDLASKLLKGIQAVMEVPGVAMITTLGLIGVGIYNVILSVQRFKMGLAEVTAMFGKKAAESVAAAQQEIVSTDRVTAAVERQTIAISANSNARGQNASVPATGPAAGGGTGTSAAAGGGVPAVVPGAGAGFKNFIKGPGGMMIGGMLLGIAASAGASALAENRKRETEEFILKMRQEELEKETSIITQMGITANNPNENQRIMNSLKTSIGLSEANALNPTGGLAEDILFITGDDGKTVKESYKLSTGDTLLPIGKQGGPLQQIFNPRSEQAINTFNESKNINIEKSTASSIAEGDKVSSVTTKASLTNTVINDKRPSSTTEASSAGNIINLVAYLTLDNQKIDLITEKISEGVIRKT